MNYSGNWIDLRPALPYVTNYIAADRQGEIMDAIKRQDMQALQQEPGFWQKLALGADAYKGVKEAQDLIQAQQAAPYDFAAKRMLADPEFRGNAEALQDFQQRPEFWTETNKISGNPNAATIMSTFANNAAQQELDTNMGNAIKQNQANPYAALDPYTLSQMYKRNDAVTNVGKIADLGTKESVAIDSRGFLNTFGNNFKVAKSASDAAQAYSEAQALFPNASKDVLEVAQKNLQTRFPEFKFATVGTGRGEERVEQAINPADPTQVIQLGQPYLPAAPKTVISNYMPAQETAFARGVGDANAKQYAGAIDDAAQSQRAMRSLDDFEKALGGTYSGKFAGAKYNAAKLLPNADKNPKVVNYELAQQGSKSLALDILTNFKGAISDGERKFATDMATNPSMEPAAQKKLIAIARREHANKLAKAQTLIQSVENMDSRSNINRTLQQAKPTVTLDAIAAERARRQKNGSQ